MTSIKYTVKDYSTKEIPTWCPGCGDFTILNAIKGALAELQIPPEQNVLVAGIGCGSLMPYWINTYGACTLHGRAIPFAKGVKVANKDLNVIVNLGDGDGLGIGLGHFAHCFRRNLDMVLIIDNNGVYGLTKGQTAPTAKKGTITSSTPLGSLEEPVNGPALALTMGATFVARGFAGDQKGLTEIIAEAIKHKGTAVIDVLQPCVSFNKVETYEFYIPRIVKHVETLQCNVSTAGPSSGGRTQISSREEAYKVLTTIQEKIPVGIFYREETPTYEERCSQMETSALVNHDISNIDVNEMMVRFS